MTSATDRSRASRLAPERIARPGRRRRVVDRVLMLDVGLVRTQSALRTLLCVPAGMAVGLALASAVGLPGVLGVLIGAMPAFISCLIINDVSAGRIAARTGAVVVPFVVALFASVALDRFHVLELALIVVLLFVQFAAMGWGPWATDAAAVVFSGYLCGLLTPLPAASVAGLALIGAGSLAVTVVIRGVFLRPMPFRSLLWTRRALLAWATAVLRAAVDLLAVGPDASRERVRAARRLRRRLDRFQEVALTADGMLAAPGAGPTGATAETLHRLLFDTHLAVDGLGRTAETLAGSGAPDDVRAAVAEAIRTVVRGGGAQGATAAEGMLARFGVTPSARADGSALAHVVHRAALQLADLAAAARAWGTLRAALPREGDAVPFRTPVVLVGGRPSGAVPVLDDALADGMTGPWRRWHVSASLRTGIQAAVAVAVVEPLALLLDGSRFYWGVIGVMIVLAGTNSTHERVRKALHRGVGTVLGGALGIVLVHLLGTHHPWWTAGIAVFALAVGTYGFGGVYAIWVTALVVVLCQVYAYGGSFTDTLIPFRLAENLLGAAVAVLVSVVVLPVASGRMVRSAVRRQLAAVRSFVLSAGLVDVGGDGPRDADPSDPDAFDLRRRSRAVDAATYQLDAVMKPMVRFPSGGAARTDARTRAALQSVAVFARELAGRPAPIARPPVPVVEALAHAAGVLATSIDALSGAVGSGRQRGEIRRGDDAWVRASDALDAAVAATPPGPAHEWVHDRVLALGRVDDALAVLAERNGLPVAGVASGATSTSARARRAAALVERHLLATDR
ncbi:FUSC family protein [Curtobacterium sp. MCBD17_035]|uniref:FUSC family protein n=1 Tax=Curtobacterium sp. MCBD17_035 TaxID=2175673 RepID=UPI000DA987BF|nr:FUSC family protein [Curtobacterium sp. MCBD17_035]WIB66060.1 FUSC family protein [Curtobacterium sp. MCBD17_035]